MKLTFGVVRREKEGEEGERRGREKREREEGEERERRGRGEGERGREKRRETMCNRHTYQEEIEGGEE